MDCNETSEVDLKFGDLVAVVTTDWETSMHEKVGLIVSVDDEYMNGVMCTVLLEGELFSIHEREARVVRSCDEDR